MPAVALTNEDRVLTLMRLVDEDARNSVLTSLPEDLRSSLRDRIRTSRAGYPSARRLNQLVDEFQRLFQCVLSIGGPQLKLHRGEQAAMDDEQFTPSGEYSTDLEEMNIFQLAAALGQESPRAAALLLNRLSADRIASVMQNLSPTHRLEVGRELARNPQAPDVVFQRLAATTINRAVTLPKEKPDETPQIIRMADVLRQIGKADRRELIESIREDSDDVATELQRAMYRFEDLLDLDDRQVQEVLAQVDSTTLQNALYGAEEAIVDKVMSNLSRRAAATLREELTYQRPISEELQNDARQAVASAIGTTDQD